MVGLMRFIACLLFAGAAFMGCASAPVNADNTCGDVTITGNLEHVKGEPADTSGWAMLLDKGLVVDGKIFNSVEVFSSRDLTPFSGKHVEASGSISNVREVGNGQHPAFVP